MNVFRVLTKKKNGQKQENKHLIQEKIHLSSRLYILNTNAQGMVAQKKQRIDFYATSANENFQENVGIASILRHEEI